MFEEHKDEKSAEEEFLQILKGGDKFFRKELIDIFSKSFRKQYKEIRNRSDTALKRYLQITDDNDKKKIIYQFGVDITQESGIAFSYLNNCSGKTEKKQAEYLGSALGVALGIIEFRITNIIFRYYGDSEWRDQGEGIILDWFDGIKKELQKLNKSIKHKFIRRRIERIAKKHSDQLSDYQQKLIARIAAIFA